MIQNSTTLRKREHNLACLRGDECHAFWHASWQASIATSWLAGCISLSCRQPKAWWMRARQLVASLPPHPGPLPRGEGETPQHFGRGLTVSLSLREMAGVRESAPDGPPARFTQSIAVVGISPCKSPRSGPPRPCCPNRRASFRGAGARGRRTRRASRPRARPDGSARRR
jgi:hypothetical protein